MREAFGIRGRLQVFELPDDIVSSKRLILDQKNLVVNNGISAFSRLLGNLAGTPMLGGSPLADLSDATVGTMELGNAAVPPPPQATDINSVGALVYTPPITVEYPDAYSVAFSGVIPILELVGTTITEEALKLRNGLVFAKVKLATPVLKTNATALQFVHTVSIVRV